MEEQEMFTWEDLAFQPFLKSKLQAAVKMSPQNKQSFTQ